MIGASKNPLQTFQVLYYDTLNDAWKGVCMFVRVCVTINILK